MASIKVTGQLFDKDLGMKNMLKLMNVLGDPRSVEIGLPKGTPQRALKLGLWHEFGTRTNTPSRPWLSHTVDTHGEKWMNEWVKDFWRVFKNPNAGQTAFHLQSRFGARAAADLQEMVISGPWVANAQATVDKKGFNWPLVENGWFADQIKYKVSPPRAVKLKK